MNETMRFLNYVGDEPTYLVPDDGKSETTTATLTGPNGKSTTLEELGRSEGHEERDTDKGPLPALGPRIAYKLPAFSKAGVYKLEAEGQTYEITVLDKPADDDGEGQTKHRAEYQAWIDGGTD